MREIIVTNRKDTDVTDEAMYALLKESYQRWKDIGLETPGLHKSLEEFRIAAQRANIFVAMDIESGELLGMHWFRVNRTGRWVYGYYLAVALSAQQEGIASRMLACEEERICQAGYRYLKGSTPTMADWSVRWHLKNGYRIIGYYHAPKDNFANYVFRKQLVPISLSSPAGIGFVLLHPVYALHSSETFCLLRYAISYAVTRLTKDSQGRDNRLGRIARIIMKRSQRSDK